MKNLLSLIFISSIALNGYCQFAWVNDTLENFDHAYQLVKTKRGYYAMLHGAAYSDGLIVLDGAGNEIYRYKFVPPPSYASYLDSRIIDMPDSTIALAVRGQGIDTVSGEGWQISYFFKFDQNWNKTLLNIDYFPYQRIIKPLSDGSLAVLDLDFENKIFLTTPNGSNIWETLLNYGCNDMLVTAADSILIATQQGLLTLDNNGNIAAVRPEFVFNHIKMDSSGRIFGATANAVTLLSADYQQLDHIDFSDEEIIDFDVTVNNLAILTNINRVVIYENDLSLFNEFELEGEEVYKFIALGADRIALAGDVFYGNITSNNYSTASFLKEYALDGFTPIFADDIGVVGLNVGSSVNIQQVGQANVYRTTCPEAIITIKNFGVNPVNQLHLRSSGATKAIFNLDILPGEEFSIAWPEFYFITNENPVGQNYNLCAWTSHPNLFFDVDSSNDTYCTDFLVNDNEVVAQSKLLIYPNPANELVNFQLKIQQPLNDIAFRIISADGRVMEEAIPSNNTASYSVYVNDWAAGMYFVQLLEEEAVITVTKFVVAR